MLEQTFVNLLVNARDAFESGGKAVRERRVVIAAELADGEAMITVTDNAGGIAPEVIDRLFDAFTTTKSADKGTGLGLSLARTVIRNMEGTITAANVGDGACFTIRLPVAVTQPPRLEVA